MIHIYLIYIFNYFNIIYNIKIISIIIFKIKDIMPSPIHLNKDIQIELKCIEDVSIIKTPNRLLSPQNNILHTDDDVYLPHDTPTRNYNNMGLYSIPKMPCLNTRNDMIEEKILDLIEHQPLQVSIPQPRPSTSESSNLWKLCTCGTIDKRLLIFAGNFSISIIMLSFSIVKLSTSKECEEQNTYVGIITLILGIWVKSPMS